MNTKIVNGYIVADNGERCGTADQMAVDKFGKQLKFTYAKAVEDGMSVKVHPAVMIPYVVTPEPYYIGMIVKIWWNHLTDDTYVVTELGETDNENRDIAWGQPRAIDEFFGHSNWDNHSVLEWDGEKWVQKS